MRYHARHSHIRIPNSLNSQLMRTCAIRPFRRQSAGAANLVPNGDFNDVSETLVLNGTFDSTDDWNLANTATISGGTLNFAASSDRATQAHSWPSHALWSLDVIDSATRFIVELADSGGSFNQKVYDGAPSDETISGLYNLSDDLQECRLNCITTAAPFSVDNFVVRGLAGGWALGDGWGVEWDGGANFWTSCDGSQTANSTLENALPIVIGTSYDVVYTVKSVSAGQVRVNVGGLTGIYRDTAGTYTESFTAVTTEPLVVQANSNFIGEVDDVYIPAGGS